MVGRGAARVRRVYKQCHVSSARQATCYSRATVSAYRAELHAAGEEDEEVVSVEVQQTSPSVMTRPQCRYHCGSVRGYVNVTLLTASTPIPPQSHPTPAGLAASPKTTTSKG